MTDGRMKRRIRIAAFLGLITDSMHTRPNVLSVVMCMGQMDLTCMKGGVPSVRMESQEYSIGRQLGPISKKSYCNYKSITI